jgi:hypothetical protein
MCLSFCNLKLPNSLHCCDCYYDCFEFRIDVDGEDKG